MRGRGASLSCRVHLVWKVARGRCEPFAFVWTVEIERRSRREYRGAPLINPTVASQGEMWIMLMQIIPSADAIGQTECKASRAMGARTFVTSVAFTQRRRSAVRSGSGSNESRKISREMDDMLA